mmetsp:Transcript_23048/g.25412  ORF Transcript_23048/g.25412 Transcript_23048/m.25412 type:complete len:133 (-) Transcript_23048:1498-1896(-)
MTGSRSVSPKLLMDKNSFSSKSKGRRSQNRRKPYPRLEAFREEEKQSRELENVLQERGLYESEEGRNKRKQVYSYIEDFLNDWSASLLPLNPVNKFPESDSLISDTDATTDDKKNEDATRSTNKFRILSSQS